MKARIKTRLLLTTLGVATSLSPCLAQHAIRMPDPLANLTRFEKKELRDQAASFFHAAQPAITSAARSMVSIGHGDRRMAYGTVVMTPGSSKPAILTKWSEVKNNHTQLIVRSANGDPLFTSVSGVYPEHDLALLRVHTPGAALIPLDLNKAAAPGLGSFVMLARPGGEVEELGVVSVQTRSLREGDKAYLGVMLNFATAERDGVALDRVVPGSAAQKAGLRKGDVITSVDRGRIKGAVEMRNLLQKLTPGSKIVVTYMRANRQKRTTVQLGSLAENKSIRRVPRERMEIMQRMGAIPSEVRSNFPSVIQSDMPIEPNDTGAPVTDLDGNLVGISIARGSRIKTFIIPTETIREVLTSPPLQPNEVLAGQTRSDLSRDQPDFARPEILPRDEDPVDQVRRLLGETPE